MATRRRSLRIAVDIGGTFTDGVAQILPGARIVVSKRMTTPDDPGRAFDEVVADLLRQVAEIGFASAEATAMMHGTTLVTNALIERKGARVALLVTRGTADILDMRREIRYDIYDLALELPQPLVARRDRFEIDERLDHRGGVVEPLDEVGTTSLLDRLPAGRFDAFAICLLHAYADDVHERQLADLIRQRLPTVPLSLSSQIAREVREYERMSTTVANAYVQPLMRRYLGGIDARMRDRGIAAPLRIMLSSGGFAAAASAAASPIHLLESGPAAGVLSAANTARLAAIPDVLTFDMGGTTAKAGLILGGMPTVVHRMEAGRVRRFKKGSGLPILGPTIDLIEIGAGGGSIASVNPMGLLAVGPRSSGAVPGPACYGKGGSEPTVTDADLLLGYLDPDYFLGGAMTLQPGPADVGMRRLARQLGLSLQTTTWGIHDLVNETMAAAARVHISEKGIDPRHLTMVATGGAGPVHAVAVAAKLNIARVLFTIAAGAGSCLGLLAAPARADRAWSQTGPLDAIDWPRTKAMLLRLRAEAVEELTSAGIAAGRIDWQLRAELRYLGQGNAVEVGVLFARLGPALAPTLRHQFATAYAKLYGRAVPGGIPQLVTWRLTGSSRTKTTSFEFATQAAGGPSKALGTRSVFLPAQTCFADVPVFDRSTLPAGARLTGPLILRERESTIVVARPARVEILSDLTVSVELD